jgi:hypothetical protein
MRSGGSLVALLSRQACARASGKQPCSNYHGSCDDPASFNEALIHSRTTRSMERRGASARRAIFWKSPAGFSVRPCPACRRPGFSSQQARAIAWSVGAVVVLTRVFLLAHWASDVVAGLALGAALERLIRLGVITAGSLAPDLWAQ